MPTAGRDAIDHARVACVCSSLRMATRTVARIYDEALRPHGIRTTQYAILVRLEREGPASLSALAARLAMDRTTLARELAPLVDRGLVHLDRGADRRQRIADLSEAGRATRDGAAAAWRVAQDAIEERFGARRSGALVDELHDLVAATRAPGLPQETTLALARRRSSRAPRRDRAD